MSDLNIETKSVGPGIYYIKAVGTLDAATYEIMERVIESLFAKAQYRLIVVLEQVTYISSAGAGVFIGAIGTAQDHGGNIVLLKPSSMVREVFSILGLEEIFPYASSVEEAITIFDQPLP